MAKSDDSEEMDEDLHGHEGGVDKEKKKQYLLALIFVIGLPLLVFSSYSMLSGFKGIGASDKEKLEIRQAERKAARRVILRGSWHAETIPELPVISYAIVGQESSQKDETETKREEIVSEDEESRTAEGELIFSSGLKKWLGPVQTEEGVVLIDRIREEKGGSGDRSIKARISNLGSQSLSEVQLEFRFKDNAGKVLQTRKINALVVAGGLFGDRSQTLSPGVNRTFEVDATQLPSAWSGVVEAEVLSYCYLP